MFSIRKFATAGLILSFAAPMVPVSSSLAQADETLGKVTLEIGLGKILTGQEQQALPKHVFANGAGLPDGEGSSLEGARIYQASCASCHGAKGQGGTALELVGDTHTQTMNAGDAWFEDADSPVKAIADKTQETAFIRCMILPIAFKGRATINILDANDKLLPALQMNHRYLDQLINLA
jgi:cytochrome c1